METLPKLHIMLYGGLGAVVGYCAVFLEKIKSQTQLPEMKLVKVALEILLLIFIGGVWVGLIIEPANPKAAILSGVTAHVALLKMLGA